MSRNALTAAIIAVLAITAGTVSAAAASPAARSSPATSKTLVFAVVFSPFTLVEANTDNPEAVPAAVGDEILAHDQLFSRGHHVGDTAFSCVVVSASPTTALANCTGVFRVPGGTIAIQTTAIPGPAPKELAVTGGTGIYRNIGGDGTLVEFGNGKGRLTLHVLSLGPRTGQA